MSKEPREFWAVKGDHFGSKWHVFERLSEAENKVALLQGQQPGEIILFKLIEHSAYEAMKKERDELKEDLKSALDVLEELHYVRDKDPDLSNIHNYGCSEEEA